MFGKFREISIENKLDDSTIVSISVQEINGFENILTDGPRFRKGSVEFENLAECLGRYRYYEKILPGAGIRGKKIKKISLTFWNDEFHIITFFTVYSEGTVKVEGKKVRCISGFNSGKDLFLELQKMLDDT